jgi:PmbA protein
MSDLLQVARSIVARAGHGESIEAYVSSGTETEVLSYEGEVESLTSATSAGVGVRVLVDGPDGARVGFASAGSLSAAVIDAVLADARDNARFATPDESVVLATPDGVGVTVLDLEDQRLSSTPTSRKIELAVELERATRDADARIRQVDQAGYGDAIVESAIASTTGIESSARRSIAWIAISAIAEESDQTQTGHASRVARASEDLDVAEAASEAVLRATRMLGAVKPASGRCAVVFDPRVTATLLSVVSSALSGESLTKGRSFFADRLGETVAAPDFTLVDDPTDPRHFSASQVDGEGLACRRNVLIDRGVLQGFVFDAISAKRAGASSTGSAIRGGYSGTPTAGCRALLLEPGTRDEDEILALVGDGIYVQSISGVHSGVNPISGDFSVGAEGMRISSGVFDQPLREMTIASTLQRLLQDVIAIGSNVEWLPGLAAGQTLAVGDISMSGA